VGGVGFFKEWETESWGHFRSRAGLFTVARLAGPAKVLVCGEFEEAASANPRSCSGVWIKVKD